uniref:REX4, RNA exonuclease 4 homolog n=1 Tax=Nothobranchius pienaari TaxID=704102 RepID=A0A1A8NC50_9TELE
MSKAKEKKALSDAKSTAKVKRKEFWIKHNSKNKFKKISAPQKHQPHLSTPPVEAQQFSSNWKALQEMLNASKPEKKLPVSPKQKVFPKKTLKNIPKTPSEKDNETKVKHTVAPKFAIQKESEVNSDVPAASNTPQPAAPKRKRDKGKSNSEQRAKRNKPVVEERKPTEDDLWFDDVDPDDAEETLGAEAAEILRRKQGKHQSKDTESMLVKEKCFEGLTKIVAIDCEMVGTGPKGSISQLARCSIVSYDGDVIYDKFIKPSMPVTDYRTRWSGIRPRDLEKAMPYAEARKEILRLLMGKIVIGHAIHNDFKALSYAHPSAMTRDTSRISLLNLKAGFGERECASLKRLTKAIFNRDIQSGKKGHSSVEDARATMDLYKVVEEEWEGTLLLK